MGEQYDPTWESIDEHPVPDWFEDAKLGIFIHWGPYSVPGWAPVGSYAEWYPFGMYREDSEIREYHEDEWGEDVEYLDFAEMWDAEHWDPEEWASFFSDVGARYVVMTGEHHDGFPLWDSHYMQYNAAQMGPERDLVGELCEAVRAEGLRFAPSYHANQNYYQPGFDGLFGHPDYDATTIEDAVPGPEYVDFMNAKHRELIRKYEPDLLWFDTPRIDGDRLDAQELVVDFYERAAEEWDKEVAVNDRAAQESWGHHGDFVTPEYDHLDDIHEGKWEMCRGVGYSFGYNRAEDEDDHLDGDELVAMFVDVVSKNGNLLINVGPRADGTIPELQRRPIETLGEWLDDNGAAIYGTTYWATWGRDPVAEAEPEETQSEEGLPDDPENHGVRYTWKDRTLYVHFLDEPDETEPLALGEHADLSGLSTAEVVATGDEVPLTVEDGVATLEIPDAAVDERATTVALSDVPNPRDDVNSGQ
ncbi:alpha-L-fucosidase [Halomicrobium mukohataei]|uniref:alpha-L-fucosidase n=1 Tax=Halomicrobium mukohataei TaxID=57705 RepID=A0A847UCD3_9EURY|nr:alpha-L-fucosidase [Halomicrobium mukohataei]NLV10126.1 alpha-L-fucosidase [Halomicrobium mukohataei]